MGGQGAAGQAGKRGRKRVAVFTTMWLDQNKQGQHVQPSQEIMCSPTLQLLSNRAHA